MRKEGRLSPELLAKVNAILDKEIDPIFRELTGDDKTGMQLALEFYGPIYLLYSIYDGAEDKAPVLALLNTHIDRFIAQVEASYRKKPEIKETHR
mgnify:CR=1 FL=1